MTDHTFTRTTAPGVYRCSCGWTGSDYQSHRDAAMRAALRATTAPVQIVHVSER